MDWHPEYVQNPLGEAFNVKSICTIHYFKYTKKFSFPGEKHDFWEMVYIDSGKVGVIADEKALELQQGEAIFHKPNEYHNIYTDDQFANSVIISFDCRSRAMSFFEGKILKLNETEKALLSRIVEEGADNYEEKLNDLYLTKMTKRRNPPFGGEQIIKNTLELLLISLVRSNTSVAKRERMSERLHSKHSDEIVSKIMNLLNQNVYSSISLSQISSELFFSKTYLKNVFKKETGTTIIQYYINLKLDEAKKLISQNKYTFTEIAYMLNFNSVHYFSRLFKIHTSMTPTEYAKSLKVEHVL